jgi:hypothetical protein
MTDQSTSAEVHIHLRARPQDRNLSDQAAELVGARLTPDYPRPSATAWQATSTSPTAV